MLLLLLVLGFPARRILSAEPQVMYRTEPAPSRDKRDSAELDSQYVGLLFASRLGFNWIVDIRVENQDQEGWAIGNLVSSTSVLTVCHTFLSHEASAKPEIKVYYCTLYLWEKFKQKDVREKGKFSYETEENAYRVAIQIQKHSKCDRSQLPYDALILKLNRAIPLVSPYIGTVPINFHVRNKDLISEKEQCLRCYVASYGRNYFNKKNHTVVDYKVKIRAHFVSWDHCGLQLSKICKQNDAACTNTPLNREKTMCFETRAKVGAICDHDRGAPLVCQGNKQLWFRGMVIRGAQWQHCNNLQPVPFIVLKRFHVAEFFGYGESPIARARGAAPRQLPNEFHTLVLVLALRAANI